MTGGQVLGYVLLALGVTGLWITSKGDWRGWLFNIAVQPVWFAFAVVIHNVGIAIGSVLYGAVFTRNMLRARKVARG